MVIDWHRHCWMYGGPGIAHHYYPATISLQVKSSLPVNVSMGSSAKPVGLFFLPHPQTLQK